MGAQNSGNAASGNASTQTSDSTKNQTTDDTAPTSENSDSVFGYVNTNSSADANSFTISDDSTTTGSFSLTGTGGNSIDHFCSVECARNCSRPLLALEQPFQQDAVNLIRVDKAPGFVVEPDQVGKGAADIDRNSDHVSLPESQSLLSGDWPRAV